MKLEANNLHTQPHSRGASRLCRSLSAPASARDELIDLAEGSTEGLSPGFWDPLGCSGMSCWTLDNDQTVGYLRHAEISTAASRWRASSATACSALTS